jgi:diacylglycerol kinase (ATP)
MKIVAIVNPVAGSRRAGTIWPRLVEAGKAAARVATWWTEGPGQAEILAARARREGYDRVVAVGGDGTLMEVANGLWWEPQGQKPSVGTVPLGTGCDYLRNFAAGRQRLEDKLATALQEATVPVSVGLAQVTGRGGEPRQRIFMGVLGAGFDAQVIARFRRLGLPGKAAYFMSGLLEIARLRHYQISGVVDGRQLNEKAALLVTGLGRYFGGGMMVAPGASVQSRRFQVVLGQRLSRGALLKLLPKIYAGKHLNHPQVATYYAGHVKVTAEPAAWVEGDGELLGKTPLEVTVIPEALQFAGHLAEG